MDLQQGSVVLSRMILCFLFVAPPEVAEGSDQEVGRSQHVEDAGIEAFAFGAAIFQIALCGHSAHGALAI